MSTNKTRIDDFTIEIQNYKNVLDVKANYDYMKIEGYKERVHNLINNTARFIRETKADLSYLQREFTTFLVIVNKIEEKDKKNEK